MKHLSYQEANQFPTPFFLFDENHLLNQVSLIKHAFDEYWNNGLIAYSVKTNSLPYLAKVMNQCHVAAEVVSEDEFDMVSKIGIWGGKIVCNGPIKHDSWISKILSRKCYLNIDSQAELEDIERYARNHSHEKFKVGLRVNNDIEDVFPNASTAGTNGSRFGFSFETGALKAAIARLQAISNVQISGLHLHISTNLRSIEIYQYIVRKFDEIVHQFGLSDIEYLDVGGGFYGEVPGKPQWCDYISAIATELRTLGYNSDSLKVIIEPGVSLLSGCFSYYAKVIDVKDTKRSHFVVLDGSRIHIDPLMHKKKSSYFFSFLQPKKELICKRVQTLVGFTCLEYDTFFSLDEETELSKGDIVCFDKVGAYTLTFSPLFISWFPAVYAISNDRMTLVRDKWTVDEFLQKSNL